MYTFTSGNVKDPGRRAFSERQAFQQMGNVHDIRETNKLEARQATWEAEVRDRLHVRVEGGRIWYSEVGLEDFAFGQAVYHIRTACLELD
ncbi:hypothetical protein PSPO01_04563 [Paraphaeosphaeria sporulosa]